MGNTEQTPHPDEINRQIVQRMKTLLVIDQKIEHLQKMRTDQKAEIDRLMKLTE